MIALLVGTPRHVAARDKLIGLLWPETETATARQLLNVSVHELRKTLGERVLLSEGETLRLDTSLLRVDLLEFEAALQGENAQLAVELYTGPFLDGLSLPDAVEFEQWQERERERLERLYHVALERQAETSERDQGPAAASMWWRRRLACTPADGRIALRLMRVLANAGNRAGALQVAALHATLLCEEFGAAPDAQVESLAAQLRRESMPDNSAQETGAVQNLRNRAVASVSPVEVRAPDLTPPQQQQHTSIHSLANRFKGYPRLLARPPLAVLLGGLALGITAIAVVVVAFTDREARSTLDPMLIAALPFRITAPDSAHNYLREGGVDLLSAHFSGDDGLPRVVDSRTMVSRWRSATGGSGDITEEEALELARSVGADRLLMVDLLVAPTRTSVSGRVLRVPDGKVEFTEIVADSTGTIDELILVERFAGRVIAKLLGERNPRVAQLSDSIAAVKAYLVGRQTSSAQAAIAHYDRALAIDSTFALAAYFRAVAAFQGPSIPLIYDAYPRAWAVRDGLSSADRAQLLALLGPNYPEPSTWREFTQAAETAARLNPSAVEAFQRLGVWLLVWGQQAGLDDWLPRGIAAFDSAIALDSTFPAPFRLYAALLKRDSSDVRRAAAHYFKNVTQNVTQRDVFHWILAQFFHDESALSEMRPQLQHLLNPGPLLRYSLLLGFPLGDVDTAIEARLQKPRAGENTCGLHWARIAVAAVRGQTARTATLAATMPAPPECPPDYTVAFLRLIEPGLAAAADSWRPQFIDRAEYYAADLWQVDPLNRSTYATMECYVALWRVAQGDTSGVRASVNRIAQLLRDVVPVLVPRAGRLGLCARVLEANVESMSGATAAPALARLDSLHRQGTAWESPTGANVMLARLLEKRGDLAGALAALRRRPPGANIEFASVLPATLREEGRLAALLGDTTVAIRAYTHYLMLRDRPDRGPMQKEVQRVRAHLDSLEHKRRRQ